jgi:hypothetical protein
MLAYEVGLGWCVIHLMAYVAWLRFKDGFYGEGRIFRYHLISATAYSVGALTLVALAPSWPAFVTAAGLIAGHGLYSISFLELWSLAQGSYSLSILAGINADSGANSHQLIERFAALGNAKRAGRLGALFQMRLLWRDVDRIKLTPIGRIVSAGCAVLRWLPNLRETG